jgi:hypothetical protein
VADRVLLGLIAEMGELKGEMGEMGELEGELKGYGTEATEATA